MWWRLDRESVEKISNYHSFGWFEVTSSIKSSMFESEEKEQDEQPAKTHLFHSSSLQHVKIEPLWKEERTCLFLWHL